jgi:hypothetical protein
MLRRKVDARPRVERIAVQGRSERVRHLRRLGDCLPCRPEALYFTPMMNFPADGSFPIAVPSGLMAGFHFSTLQVPAS